MTNPNIGVSYKADPLAATDLVRVYGPAGAREVTITDFLSAANGGSPPFITQDINAGVTSKTDPLASTYTIEVVGTRGRRHVTLSQAAIALGASGTGATRSNPNIGTSYLTDAISIADTIDVYRGTSAIPAAIPYTLTDLAAFGAASLPFTFDIVPDGVFGLGAGPTGGNTANPMGIRALDTGTVNGSVQYGADGAPVAGAVTAQAQYRVNMQTLRTDNTSAGRRSSVFTLRNTKPSPTFGSVVQTLGTGAEPVIHQDLMVNGLPAMSFQLNSALTLPASHAFDKANHTILLVSAPDISTMPVNHVRLGAADVVKFGQAGAPNGLTVVEGGSRFLVSQLIPTTGEWCVMGYTSHPTTGVTFILNNTLGSPGDTGPLTAGAITGGFWGDLANYTEHAMLFEWATAMTPAQLQSAARSAMAYFNAQTVRAPTRGIIYGVDSRCVGQGSTDNQNVTANLARTLNNPGRYRHFNLGEVGQTVSAVYTNRIVFDRIKAAHPELTSWIYVMLDPGINDDRGSISAATTAANQRAIAQYTRDLGFYNIGTSCSADGSATGLANKAITDARNTDLNATHTQFDAWYNLSSQTYATNTADTTYYTTDLLHHTNAFYALEAAALKTLIDAAP